ncbi:hypothetical protein Tco_0754740 [Tanacetum coccineum]
MSGKMSPSGLVPQGQKASDYDNSGLVPPRQNVVPPAEKTDSSQQGFSLPTQHTTLPGGDTAFLGDKLVIGCQKKQNYHYNGLQQSKRTGVILQVMLKFYGLILYPTLSFTTRDTYGSDESIRRRISVRPCCFNNPRTSSPPYQPFSPPPDYTSGPLPTSPLSTSPISPTHHNSDLLTTPRSTPPPLTSPPPAPTQPSKLTSPLAINLDPIELLFSTPPTSPQAFLDSLDDLSPSTTNPPPPRPSFDTIERMANAPPHIPPIDSTFPSPTLNLEPSIPPFSP